MSDIGEGLGTAVEGGLFAKAVADEAGSSRLEKGHFTEKQCLNCGTQLSGPHCHNCGQKAHLHRTIGAFLHDLLHGALHLDGKTWRTLPLLIRKPGQLTRRYVEGERARFVSPMALFLFSIFLMFAVFQVSGISAPTDLPRAEVDPEQLRDTADTAKKNTAQMRADLLAELENMPADAPERAEAEQQLKELDQADEFIGNAEDFVLGQEGNKSVRVGSELSGVGWIDKGVNKWRENPGLMLYKLQANFYKFSWLLIPLSIPFVWLLFAWKRRFKAYDHAIFVTYSLAFMSLLFIALALGGLIGLPGWLLITAGILVPPIHIYKHMKYAYDLSRFGAIWRLTILTGFIVTVLLLFLQLLVLLGIMG